jgi:hypothetical protein
LRGVRIADERSVRQNLVDFQGKRYQTCSTAAEYARSKATGRIMHTNSWSFWQLIDSNGKKRTLFDVRDEFIRAKGNNDAGA